MVSALAKLAMSWQQEGGGEGGSLQSFKTFIMSPTGPTHWTALQGGQQMQLFLVSIPPICFIPAQHLGSIWMCPSWALVYSKRQQSVNVAKWNNIHLWRMAEMYSAPVHHLFMSASRKFAPLPRKQTLICSNYTNSHTSVWISSPNSSW